MEQISTISIGRSRLALLLLASSVFAVGTEGLVFAGLLPALSSDLGVSLGAAGQVTTVFALCYAVFAPLLSMSTESLPRRTTLLIGLGLFVAGNALSATAPAYWCLLIWRAVTAAGASLITPTATLIAASLARPDGRARAIAVGMTGRTPPTGKVLASGLLRQYCADGTAWCKSPHARLSAQFSYSIQGQIPAS